MAAKINLNGHKFGRLVVLKEIKERSNAGGIVWECRCSCGKNILVKSGNLRSGHTKSCGCLKLEVLTKHGLINTSEYTVWQMMLQRCNNSNHSNYRDYGGRGIKVCKRWHDFENFIADMGNRPSYKHTIDRINNNKGYEPNNCKWSTPIEQQSNRRDNVYVDYKGERLTQAEAARREGVARSTLIYRVRKGLFKLWAV